MPFLPKYFLYASGVNRDASPANKFSLFCYFMYANVGNTKNTKLHRPPAPS